MKEKITTQNFDQLTFGPREKKSVQSKVHDVVQHYIPIYTGIQHNIFLYIPVFKKKESGCSQTWTENPFKKYYRMTFFCFRSSSSILNVKKTCSINLSIVNSKVGISDGLLTQVLISEFDYYILDTLIKCECSEAQSIIIINRTNKL